MKKFSLVLFSAALFAAIIGVSSCNKALELGLKLDDEQICIPAQQFVAISRCTANIYHSCYKNSIRVCRQWSYIRFKQD
jgi:hypothetical protein